MVHLIFYCSYRRLKVRTNHQFLQGLNVLKVPFYYFVPIGVRSMVMSVAVCLYVCLSACPLVYLKNHASKRFCTVVRVIAGCSSGSVLLLRQLNTLCTSGFMDDVMFSHVMGLTACSIGNTYASAVLKQAVINFQRIPRVAPLCNFIVVQNGSRLPCLKLKLTAS